MADISGAAGGGPAPRSNSGGRSKWSDFGIRLASAAVLAPVALLALWRGGAAWELLIGAAMIGLGGEWARLAGMNSRVTLPLALAMIWFTAVFMGQLPAFALLAVLTGMLAWRAGRFAAAGLPYAGIGGLALLWLRLQPDHGLYNTVFLVAVIWGTDIGAYLTGRLLGGKKLAPKISPGKTWSGSLGGLLIGGFAGALLAGVGAGIDWRVVVAGFLLSFFAQAGDLLESAIKRKLGVKDSGRTIPGHGGLFDRLDGFLVASPLAAILAFFVHGGLPLWG